MRVFAADGEVPRVPPHDERRVVHGPLQRVRHEGRVPARVRLADLGAGQLRLWGGVPGALCWRVLVRRV